MVQDILTIISIAGASAYTIYSLIRIIVSAKQKKTACPGCSACAQPKQTIYKFDKKIAIKSWQ